MPTQITFQPAGNKPVTRKGLERVADVDSRLTRSHYFDNRLLTAEDLTRDQIYLDERLREVGRALGSGVMNGLQLSLNTLDGEITVQPGTAVNRAGRILELTRSLTLNLHDKAQISELNKGRYRRFNRALYAVIIQYTEVGTDIAEVFPTDLGDKKTFNYDVITEAVQIAMVPLPLPLMQQDSLHIRAHLMQQFYGDDGAIGSIPEEAVALGVLAIYNDRPQWLDAELLRQPVRAQEQEGDLQADLSRRYETLYRDIMDDRESRSLDSDFSASTYFRWLPPVGSLPKATIDPEAGRQGFFPENYNVWVAPVRRSELSLIAKESMVLPPLDIGLGEPMDIVVLAPLNGSDYNRLAARLERSYDSTNGKPGGLDLLRLRLYPRRPVHKLDLDKNTWNAIWDLVGEDELIYVRRPLRTAETQLSGIILNQPVRPVEPVPAPETPSPSDGNLVVDENSVFLKRINIKTLIEQRDFDSDASREAQQKLLDSFGESANQVMHMLNILLRIDRRFDALIWQTLLAVANSENLNGFYKTLEEGQENEKRTTDIILDNGAEFGMNRELLREWSELRDE